MAKCTYTIILTNGETIEVSQDGVVLQDFSGNIEIGKFIENKEKINALLYNFKKFDNSGELEGEDLKKAKFYTGRFPTVDYLIQSLTIRSLDCLDRVLPRKYYCYCN